MKFVFEKTDFDSEILRRFKNSVVKFPVNFWTTEGGEFLGDLLTDGFYQKSGCTGYCNSQIENIISNLRSTNKLFSKKSLEMKEVRRKIRGSKDPKQVVDKLKVLLSNFGVYFNIRFLERTGTFEISYSSLLGLFLDKLDIPRGRRSITNPKLPEMITQAPDPVICAFLRRVITNEATITRDGQIRINETILSSHRSPELLRGYKELFEKLGIKVTNPRASMTCEKKDGKHITWDIYTRPFDLPMVLKKIKIDSKQKRRKAENFLKSVKCFRIQRSERNQQIISIIKQLKKPFTVHDILASTDLKRTSVYNYLNGLVKKGIVVRGDSRKFYPMGSDPFLYYLTKDGEELENSANSI